MTTPVHLLISPDGGRGRADRARDPVLATLEAAGFTAVDITGPDVVASTAAAAGAVFDGAKRLIVVGGDGLVHLGLQAVAGSGTTLGIIPVGTGNDFARGMGIDDDDITAATRVALGPGRPIDAIRVGDTWVASVATAGFSGDVNARANRLRFPRGASRYSFATAAELPRLRRRDVTLTVDDESQQIPVTLLAVANTAWFGGGMQICPGADPTDGLLDITIVGDIGRFELLRVFRLVFSGRHLSHPKVGQMRGRRITIEGDDLTLWGDGERLGTSPITLTAAPGVLSLATR